MSIERKIIKALLEEIVKGSKLEFAVSYDNGYDDDEDQMTYTRDPKAAMKHIEACDIEHIMLRKPGEDLAFAWVMLVYGNGCDVISDYTTSAEPFVDAALERLGV